MIFVEVSDVQPIRYPDVSMRTLIGAWAGKALIERQRALVLLNAEVMYAEGMWKAWLKLRARIDRDVAINEKHRERARASQGTMVSVAPDYQELASWFEAQLREFGETVDAGTGRSREAVMTLRNQFGSRVPEERFRRDAGEHSPLHQLIGDFDCSVDVEARYDECIGLFNQRYHGLKELAERREAFARTRASYRFEWFSQLSGTGFEEQIAKLLERDGFAIERRSGGPGDEGADVIAKGPDGRRWVLQCKQRSTNPVEATHLYQLNGTAVPVHRADVVGIVTNLWFTEPARKFAESQGIHLIDDDILRRWATYGESLADLLQRMR